MAKRKRKTGKEFEQLIAWIQECLHDRAKIEVNTKVKDVDTGWPRQIDIGLRLSDGPTEFFGIVEVRDRIRPIGVRYVEEISAKRRSVRADAVFLVSRSGFTQTALTKAKQLGIRALTYDEATSADWSNWLRCRIFSVYVRKYEDVNIAFSEFGSNTVMAISLETLGVFENDRTSKILRTEDGIPYISLPDLVRMAINSLSDKLYENIEMDGTRHRRTVLIDETQYKPTLFIEGNDGKPHRIGKIRIEADYFYECTEYPFRLMRYREPGAPESIAEVATADIEIGESRFRLDLIAPGAGPHIPAGATVSIKMTPLEQQANDQGDSMAPRQPSL